METVNAEVEWRPDNTKVSKDNLDFFYPELGLQEKWLSDDAYARALDKFSDVKMGQLVSRISIEMLKMHDLGLEEEQGI